MIMETNGVLHPISKAKLISNMECFENHYPALHLMSTLQYNLSSNQVTAIHSTQIVATQLSGG
jgi:hypothetical protein